MSDLIKDLQIDVKNLDVEWVTLPELYFKYSEESDLKDIALRKKKLQIEQREAELHRYIKTNSEKYCEQFLTKTLTENLIKSILLTDEELIQLYDQSFMLEKEKKVLLSICKSLEMKKDSLKNLVTLYCGEYYSVPKTDAEGTKFINAQLELSVRDLRKEIKKRLRRENINETIKE